jgi:hypothetical protein
MDSFLGCKKGIGLLRCKDFRLLPAPKLYTLEKSAGHNRKSSNKSSATLLTVVVGEKRGNYV